MHKKTWGKEESIVLQVEDIKILGNKFIKWFQTSIVGHWPPEVKLLTLASNIILDTIIITWGETTTRRQRRKPQERAYQKNQAVLNLEEHPSPQWQADMLKTPEGWSFDRMRGVCVCVITKWDWEGEHWLVCVLSAWFSSVPSISKRCVTQLITVSDS